ncbi:putative HTH-type transcriptional regulator [Candidatus Rickettsia kotlanii]|nr:putative HTH-type transcriptional regulator [Candidatus Rickettsia kotlanii]BDU61074.1 putative HTH-type transcriptional regulator [Candidatus Rickettsia kotlanii]
MTLSRLFDPCNKAGTTRHTLYISILYLFRGNMALATKVKEFLEEKLKQEKIDRKYLAEVTNIPYTTVSRIMRAEANREFNPEIDTILKIAKYFNCTMDEVIKRKVQNNL